MTEYREYEQDTAPGWMAGFWGSAWDYVMGLAKDALVQAARDAVKARFAAIAPVDALPRLLRDFVLDDPYNETTDGVRARLAQVWTTWSLAGTKAGLIAALETAGYTNVTLTERAGPTWRDFTVTLRPPFAWDHLIQPWARWDDGWLWDGGYRWAGIAPPGERERVLAIIRKWKPTHARLKWVLVEVAGPYWGETTWGGSTWGGSAEFWSDA